MNSKTNSLEMMKSNSPEIHAEKYIIFKLGKLKFAIPLLQIKEVTALTPPTPIPFTPKYFRGIINLRGQVLSIIDLRSRFNFEATDKNQETAIIIVDLPEISLGIVVDGVDSVNNILSDQIQSPPSTDKSWNRDFVKGVIQQEDGLILLLEIEKLLNDRELRDALNKTRSS
jgi:purine-binding chemotaxis protein CheW